MASTARDRAPRGSAAQRLRSASNGYRLATSEILSQTLADDESSQRDTSRRGQQPEHHTTDDVERGRVPPACFEETERLERERAESGVAAEESRHQQEPVHRVR